MAAKAPRTAAKVPGMATKAQGTAKGVPGVAGNAHGTARGALRMAEVQRRLFTVAEYHQMLASGILGEDDRVELIEGEIIEMNPIGSRHAACVRRLARTFFEQVAGRAIVSVQDPVRLGDRSEPQPDLALLKPRPDFYAGAHPGPEDVLLLVEVADASADYDREVKLPLFARAGVSEVWLVDLEGRTIEVYRHPTAAGYRDASRLAAGEEVSPQALPDIRARVDQVLG